MKIDIEKLEEIRKAYKEDIRVFSKRIGISHQTYYNLQKGNGQPTLDTVSTIAKNLKFKDPKDLLI